MTTTLTQLTLMELANRTDPTGNLATIAEVLTEMNEILIDAPWVEANNQFAHRITRRASLPSGTWRRVNQGVAYSSSQTIPVSEAIGILEAFSRVDRVLVDTAPNPTEFRNDEATPHIEGLSQDLAYALIYGDASTTPETMTGLAPRLNATSLNNVVSEGGSSALTSIYVVQWGKTKTHMIYPKGHKAIGVEHKDIGLQIVNDASSNPYLAYVDNFVSNSGLCVRDDRNIARYCNIETGSGATLIFNEDLLIGLINEMPNGGKGAVIYCNSKVKTQMQIRLKDKTNVNFTQDSGDGLSGKPLMRFNGCPIRQVDQISNAETAVS